MTATQHANDDVSGSTLLTALVGFVCFMLFVTWGAVNVAGGCGNKGGECFMVPWVSVDQPQ